MTYAGGRAARAMERLKRAELVQMRIQDLVAESERLAETMPPDVSERMDAVEAEVRLLVGNLREIQREQLAEDVTFYDRLGAELDDRPARSRSPLVRLVGWLVERRPR